jgi:CMP-N-acetylneuraminic acid synthetase
MKAYGFIFAREGSKGIPNKNTSPLCGKPLIAHAIETGMATGRLEKVIVSTDSEQIADIAKQYGALVPFLRPAHLATDTANEWLAWQHAVQFLMDAGEDFDTFVSLPATAPLRTVSDVLRCLALFEQGDCDLVLTYANAHRSPHFNMLSVDENAFARIAVPLEKTPIRRQDAPLVYDATTVAYISCPRHILNARGLWDGKVKGVKVDTVNALDIDEPIDLEMAEFFMRKRLGDMHAKD